MAWIESHQTLREHPKVYALMDALGISKPQAIGHLHLLWWWCVDYAPNGMLTQNDSQISRAGEWTGDPSLFVEAVVTAGFLDRGDGVLTIHDWLDFCGPLIMKRIERKQERQTLSAERQTKIAESVPTVPNRTVPTRPTKPKTKTLRFEKPSAALVSAYAKTIGFFLDGEKFVNHYESKGWVVGKAPMKDWKAAVRTWKTNGYDSGGSNANGNTRPGSYQDRLLERESKPNDRRNMENVPSVQGGMVFPQGLPVLK